MYVPLQVFKLLGNQHNQMNGYAVRKLGIINHTQILKEGRCAVHQLLA